MKAYKSRENANKDRQFFPQGVKLHCAPVSPIIFRLDGVADDTAKKVSSSVLSTGRITIDVSAWLVDSNRFT